MQDYISISFMTVVEILKNGAYLCRWKEKKVLVTSHRALYLTSRGALSLIFLTKLYIPSTLNIDLIL